MSFQQNKKIEKLSTSLDHSKHTVNVIIIHPIAAVNRMAFQGSFESEWPVNFEVSSESHQELPIRVKRAQANGVYR